MKALLTTLALGSMLFLPSCSESSAATKQEAAMEESIGLMDRMADELTKIKDSESAKAGMAEIEKIVDEMAEVMGRAKDLGEPIEALSKKFAPQLKAAQQKITQAMMAMVMNPEVQPVLEEFQKKMAKLKDVMPK
ncbi:MAG: hypothetical protein KDB80_10795 [Planctomycetes bacterium]|nr:hypothetical protein [Planctomycetota bacterium]